MQFTVFRNSISIEEFVQLFYKYKNELGMKEEFHINDAYYETNDYSEGNYKLWIGYCMQILEQYHKPFVQDELNKIRKKTLNFF